MGYHTERMAGIGYGMAFGRRRQLMEDPRFFLSCLPAPRGGVCDGDSDNSGLTAHKRGGCGATRSAWRERVLGPLWLPPPFPLRESLFGDSSSFHFSCESDGVSLPQAVRSPQYTIS